jgi:hypothetical protein
VDSPCFRRCGPVLRECEVRVGQGDFGRCQLVRRGLPCEDAVDTSGIVTPALRVEIALVEQGRRRVPDVGCWFDWTSGGARDRSISWWFPPTQSRPDFTWRAAQAVSRLVAECPS